MCSAISPDILTPQESFVRWGEGKYNPLKDFGLFSKYAIEHGREIVHILTDVGLAQETLRPLLTGDTVTLDQPSRQALLRYLSLTLNWENQFGDFKKHRGPAATFQNFQYTRLLDASPEDIDISISGPIIQIQTNRDLLEWFTPRKSVRGMRMAFPSSSAKGGKGEQQVEFTDQLSIIIVDKNIRRGGQNVVAHERWHALDEFRLFFYEKYKYDPQIGVYSSLYPENPDRYLKRLSAGLYDPKSLKETLGKLNAVHRSLYNLYVRMNSEVDTSPEWLMVVQKELPAWIAGFIDTEKPGISGQNTDSILANMVRYLPLDKLNMQGFQSISHKMENGNLIVDSAVLSKILEKGDEPFGENIFPEFNLLQGLYSNYEKPNAEENFRSDLQFFIDTCLNPGGEIADVVTSTKNALFTAVESFNRLAIHYKSSYRALLELSLFPITQWSVITAVELKKNKYP